MKKVIIPVIVIIAALAGIFFVLNKNKSKNEAKTAVVAQSNAAVAVRAEVAGFKELNAQYVNNGVFEPRQEVIISSEIAGKVARVLVSEGAHVGAGQTLAVIEGDKQDVTLSNARAVYNNALAEVTRFESAYASGGVTKQQLDQVKLQLENAKNNLRSAQITASDVNVKASFPGIVNKRSVEPGMYVNPGQQLFEVVNVATLKLTVNVDEKTIGSISKGRQVTVECAALPGQTWTGIVTFIAPKADGSLNFPVEMEIKNNTGNELKAGMYGTARFGSDIPVNVFAIPSTAFVGNVSSNRVFVVENGKAMLKQVVSGRNFGDYVEILSGVKEGDRVITSGQINLLNETPVQIIK